MNRFVFCEFHLCATDIDILYSVIVRAFHTYIHCMC